MAHKSPRSNSLNSNRLRIGEMSLMMTYSLSASSFGKSTLLGIIILKFFASVLSHFTEMIGNYMSVKYEIIP